MNLSAPFIGRPVAVILCSLGLLIAGLLAYRTLPVASLPRVEFPVVVVSAQLAGASPETMANSVAGPLLREFSTIPAIQATTATNTQGSTTITLEFALSRSIDQAGVDVQAAIGRAQRQLPHDMEAPPSYRKFNPADAPVLLLVLTSGRMSASRLDAFARRVIVPGLSSVEGVGQVAIQGSQKFAIRIQLDPSAAAARGIGSDEIEQAIRAANANTPTGTIKGEQRSIIKASTQLADVAAFRDLIVANRSGRPVRLGDLALVTESVEDDQSASRYDGTSALVLAINRQSDANTIEVVRRLRAQIPHFVTELGPDSTIETVNDQSASIHETVDDVQLTLVLTSVLVVLVMWLFTGRLGTTLVLTIALPLSVVASFAAMYLLGFSLNTVTLLALTLAVGLVVDDAIVVQESIQRRLEQGLPSYEAAMRGAGEIGFTIVSITASLIAAFIPVLAMGGLVGRILNEFAVTLSIALVVSALVSLTLTPALAGRMPARAAGNGHPTAWAFASLSRAYRIVLDTALRFRLAVLLVFVGTVVGTVWLARAVPKGFFPQEDLGQVVVSTEASQQASFDKMADLQAGVERIVRDSPHVAHVVSILGGAGSSPNQGRLLVELKPRQNRQKLDVVLRDLRRSLADDPGVTSIVSPAQNMRGGRQSRSQYQFAVQGTDFDQLARWSTRLASVMRHEPIFVGVTTDLQNTALQATVHVDRDKARLLGISADQLRSTLYAGFGPRQVTTIEAASDNYAVLLEYDLRTASMDRPLDAVFVRSSTGTLVPLSAIATVERTAGPLAINMVGQLPSVTVSFDLAPRVSLGEAVKTIEAIKDRESPPLGVSIAFSGTARAFQEAVAGQGWLILAALATVYLVLGILYESFVHPLTIMAGLPSAALGALGTLYLAGIELSIPGVIGILLLIGVVKKNAIMMVDAALVRQREGAPALEAIREACLQRFRPITMTTLAAVAGAAPIALGLGTSVELRQPLGLAVLGGLVISQALTLFITPVLFLMFEDCSSASRRLFAKLGLRESALPAR